MQDQVKELMQKKMDRKEFLKHVGVGVVALTGITAILKALNPASNQGGSAYGTMAYGGAKKPAK